MIGIFFVARQVSNFTHSIQLSFRGYRTRVVVNGYAMSQSSSTTSQTELFQQQQQQQYDSMPANNQGNGGQGAQADEAQQNSHYYGRFRFFYLFDFDGMFNKGIEILFDRLRFIRKCYVGKV